MKWPRKTRKCHEKRYGWDIRGIMGSGGTPLMIAAPLIALDLPLKVLVWQDYAGQAWVSYVGGAALAQRYGLPADLAPNLAGLDGLVAAALHA